MEGNIAATYTLIYRFLKRQSQIKAAEAVKKAAKPLVVIRDDIEQEGPPLEDIVRDWKVKENTKSVSGASSEDPDSSDDTSSDSEDSSDSDSRSEDTTSSESEDDDGTTDSDDSGDTDEEKISKKLPQKAAERDTSVTLSSAGENAREAAAQLAQIPKKTLTKDTVKPIKDKNKASESDSSDSDSSDSDSSDSDSSSNDSASDSSDAESSSSSSGSSDSSDEDETSVSEEAPRYKTRSVKDKGSTTSESRGKEDVHVAKKRKLSEHGAAVTASVATGSQQTAGAKQSKEQAPLKFKGRFQRVKVQNLAPELLLDNGFKARGGAGNDYGERAHHDLIVTRGAGFRKEKNKKKRGSYRGGEITMESHSIKFDF